MAVAFASTPAPPGWPVDGAFLRGLSAARTAGATWDDLAAKHRRPPLKFKRVYSALIGEPHDPPALPTPHPVTVTTIAELAVESGWVAARRAARTAGIPVDGLRAAIQPYATALVTRDDPPGDGEPAHGQYSRYTHFGCRCEPCRYANATTRKGHLIDAAAATAAVTAALQAGCTVSAIAREADLSRRSVRRIANGACRLRGSTARTVTAAVNRLLHEGT